MASQTPPPDLVIQDLRGGMNDDETPHILPDDQCIVAENVEFYLSTLGERRRGCDELDLTGSNLTTCDHLVHLSTHLPRATTIPNTELWAIAATLGTGTTIAHRVGATWTPITPTDLPTTTSPEVLQIRSESVHGKWFVAYKSAQDRMHVWDGTTLRRTGLAEPVAAPTAVATGTAGTFANIRFYRVRYVEQIVGIVVRRSEPSAELAFTPDGTKTGAVVTRPALLTEGETHWELEASDGDGDWYRIATIAAATTTSTDTTSPASDYGINGVLSDDIGDYSLIPSVRFVRGDQDRLIFGGSWTNTELGSRLYWTPVWAAPGVGNDERIPADTDNFLDLDWQAGGGLTGLSTPIRGAFYAFKFTRMYRVQRTGTLNDAYEAFLLSDQHGALVGSMVDGLDEFGRGCVYFIDPAIGPARVGISGVQTLKNLRQTWRRMNTAAEQIVTHGVYYPDKQQVHWWIATDGAATPDLEIVLQVNHVRTGDEGASGGWSTATGVRATAWCSTVFPETVTEIGGSTLLSFKPYLGMSPVRLLRSDVGADDDGTVFRARIRTKPYIQAGVLNRWGAMSGALLTIPAADPTTSLTIRVIRDFGLEENHIDTDFVSETTEYEAPAYLIKVYDDLVMAGAKALQVEFVE